MWQVAKVDITSLNMLKKLMVNDAKKYAPALAGQALALKIYALALQENALALDNLL